MVEPKDEESKINYQQLSTEIESPVERGILDPEDGEKGDRMGFIRKVYGILSV